MNDQSGACQRAIRFSNAGHSVGPYSEEFVGRGSCSVVLTSGSIAVVGERAKRLTETGELLARTFSARRRDDSITTDRRSVQMTSPDELILNPVIFNLDEWGATADPHWGRDCVVRLFSSFASGSLTQPAFGRRVRTNQVGAAAWRRWRRTSTSSPIRQRILSWRRQKTRRSSQVCSGQSSVSSTIAGLCRNAEAPAVKYAMLMDDDEAVRFADGGRGMRGSTLAHEALSGGRFLSARPLEIVSRLDGADDGILPGCAAAPRG